MKGYIKIKCKGEGFDFKQFISASAADYGFDDIEVIDCEVD